MKKNGNRYSFGSGAIVFVIIVALMIWAKSLNERNTIGEFNIWIMQYYNYYGLYPWNDKSSRTIDECNKINNINDLEKCLKIEGILSEEYEIVEDMTYKLHDYKNWYTLCNTRFCYDSKRGIY